MFVINQNIKDKQIHLMDYKVKTDSFDGVITLYPVFEAFQPFKLFTILYVCDAGYLSFGDILYLDDSNPCEDWDFRCFLYELARRHYKEYQKKYGPKPEPLTR